MKKKLLNVQLCDIMDVEVLMDAQKKISELLEGFSIITADCDGNTIGEMVNFIPFCALIRSSKEGAKRCQANGALLSRKAYEHGCTWIHDCHMGLRDCAAPIVLDGMYLGAVLGGQAFLEGEENKRSQFDVEKISRELSLPQDKLREAIDKIPVVPENYLRKCMECYGFLANYFAQVGLKNMTQKLLLQESNEKLIFQKEAQEARLKTIEAQINPHFLFNTLNSLARIAMFEGAKQTEEMVYCLADLLRYNLRQKEKLPMIGDEFDNLRHYLALQKVRYRDRLNYNIEISEDLKFFRIPAMILQPIVENAIIHGLEPIAKGGSVLINCRRTEKGIVIRVFDDGLGFKPDILKKLFVEDKAATLGIGLTNSQSRLKAYFGNEYGLNINSSQEEGTVVEIHIPAITRPLEGTLAEKEDSLC